MTFNERFLYSDAAQSSLTTGAFDYCNTWTMSPTILLTSVFNSPISLKQPASKSPSSHSRWPTRLRKKAKQLERFLYAFSLWVNSVHSGGIAVAAFKWRTQSNNKTTAIAITRGTRVHPVLTDCVDAGRHLVTRFLYPSGEAFVHPHKKWNNPYTDQELVPSHSRHGAGIVSRSGDKRPTCRYQSSRSWLVKPGGGQLRTVWERP